MIMTRKPPTVTRWTLFIMDWLENISKPLHRGCLKDHGLTNMQNAIVTTLSLSSHYIYWTTWNKWVKRFQNIQTQVLTSSSVGLRTSQVLSIKEKGFLSFPASFKAFCDFNVSVGASPSITIFIASKSTHHHNNSLFLLEELFRKVFTSRRRFIRSCLSWSTGLYTSFNLHTRFFFLLWERRLLAIWTPTWYDRNGKYEMDGDSWILFVPRAASDPRESRLNFYIGILR